jgi:hypothetical protein
MLEHPPSLDFPYYLMEVWGYKDRKVSLYFDDDDEESNGEAWALIMEGPEFLDNHPELNLRNPITLWNWLHEKP